MLVEAPVLRGHDRVLHRLRHARERHPRAPHAALAQHHRDQHGLEPRRMAHVGRGRPRQPAEAAHRHQRAVAEPKSHALGPALPERIGRVGKAAQEDLDAAGRDRPGAGPARRSEHARVAAHVELGAKVGGRKHATRFERHARAVDARGKSPRRSLGVERLEGVHFHREAHQRQDHDQHRRQGGDPEDPRPSREPRGETPGPGRTTGWNRGARRHPSTLAAQGRRSR